MIKGPLSNEEFMELHTKFVEYDNNKLKEQNRNEN